jgi:UDP-glucose 4-epimerase
VYGVTQGAPIREDHPLRPISLYGATKAGCEALLSAFHGLCGTRCWVFRFANIIGPRVRTKGRTVISDFIHRLRENPHHLTIFGNGRQSKSYLLSAECVEAMLHVVEHAPGSFDVVNLGGSDTISVRRIADMVVEAMGLQNVEYTFTGGEGGWPGDVPRFLLDVTALSNLGWKATRNSEQAVAAAIGAMLQVETAVPVKPT